jgi:carboxypeptidase C (cathepsin A)
MGGFVTRYEGDFDYLTIRGSGHMVPQYKPKAALAFLNAWLANEDYPRLAKGKEKVVV